MESTDKGYKKFAPAVANDLPEFVRVDHPVFVAFLEAYFEWLESGYSEFSPADLKYVADVDHTLDVFEDHFRNQYLRNFPKKLATTEDGRPVDQAKFIKNIREFYRSKGTEKSYNLLFNILYNSDVEIYLPKTDILRASDGNFIKETSIRISNNLGRDIFLSTNKRIRQIDSTNNEVKANARVQRVVVYREGPFEVAELFLSDIQGTFEKGLPIEFETSESLTPLRESETYSVLNSITVNSGGKGHAIGERLNISSSDGSGAVAEVSRVGPEGEVRKIRILDFGVNYNDASNITLTFTTTEAEWALARAEYRERLVNSRLAIGETQEQADEFADLVLGGITEEVLRTLVLPIVPGILDEDILATATPSVGPVCAYDGYYADDQGKLSSKKRLQDNRYYQEFSYVIQSEIAISQYKDAVKQLIHPSGMSFFGAVSIKRCARDDLITSSALAQFELPIIGHYTPYKTSTTEDLSLVYPNGYLSPVAGMTLAKSGVEGADPFWIIYPHPNTRSLDGIPAGISFGAITIENFIRIDTGASFQCSSLEAPNGVTAV